MFWAFVLFAILAAGLVKLGALTVWVGVLSGALKLLGLLALLALVCAALLLRRERSKP